MQADVLWDSEELSFDFGINGKRKEMQQIHPWMILGHINTQQKL